MNRLVVTMIIATALPTAAQAQSIPIKTVPVAEGNQFMVFPSRNLAMGGVSIALDDPLLDPFVNPAKGIEMGRFRFTSSPMLYGIVSDLESTEGSGRTLPVGMLVRQSDIFGGVTLALQDIAASEQQSFSRPNLYGSLMGGLQIPGTKLSVGAGVFLADLHSLEGVRMLYQTGGVRQSGGMQLYRAGAYYRWDDGRTADLVLLHHRFNMTHRMDQPVWWEGDLLLSSPVDPSQRIEHDETQGWAVQAGYRQPINSEWQIGGRITADWKWHPKIPNYDLMQIPRDPGNSSAYQIGVGISRQRGDATFGVDLIYEPIWSHTWADAIADVQTPSGRTIRPGEMTVENFFRFHNAHLRMGLEHIGEKTDFLFGINAHAITYTLDQENFAAEQVREQDEGWIEWTLSMGFGFKFPEFQMRYTGLMTLGTGQPGIASGGGWFRTADAASYLSGGNFIIAPNGDLALRQALVLTNQVSIVVPFGN